MHAPKGKPPNLWPTLIFALLTSMPWAIACGPTPPEPKPPIDPSVVSCADYCRHIRDELHCPQGAPTKKGASCEVVCGNVENSGYVQNARACSMRAQTCAAVSACEE